MPTRQISPHLMNIANNPWQLSSSLSYSSLNRSTNSSSFLCSTTVRERALDMLTKLEMSSSTEVPELCCCPTWLWSGWAVLLSNSRWQQRTDLRTKRELRNPTQNARTILRARTHSHVCCTCKHPGEPMYACSGFRMYIQTRHYTHTLSHTLSHGWTTNEGAAGEALMWNREIRICSGPRSHK